MQQEVSIPLADEMGRGVGDGSGLDVGLGALVAVAVSGAPPVARGDGLTPVAVAVDVLAGAG